MVAGRNAGNMVLSTPVKAATPVKVTTTPVKVATTPLNGVKVSTDP
jgi:hypothetical protein